MTQLDEIVRFVTIAKRTHQQLVGLPKRSVEWVLRDLFEDYGLSREQKADMWKLLDINTVHDSDCSTSIAPAEEPGPCDCSGGSVQ